MGKGEVGDGLRWLGYDAKVAQMQHQGDSEGVIMVWGPVRHQGKRYSSGLFALRPGQMLDLIECDRCETAGEVASVHTSLQ